VEDDHEEGRRVDRAVVRKFRNEAKSAREVAAAVLVKDFSRLLARDLVDDLALEPRQRAQRPGRKIGAERDGLVAGQRIASEQRHEPRNPGGDEVFAR